MQEINGNLWTAWTAGAIQRIWSGERKIITCITTNGAVRKDGQCVMGRGCALEAKTNFPGLANHIGNLIKQHGNRCFALHQWGLATFVVKRHWSEKADLELIRQSAHQITEMADKFGWEIVVIPRPGCGNGQLDWEDVKPILEEVLDDRFLIITF